MTIDEEGRIDILVVREVKNQDQLTINDAKKKLLRCPVCGAKAFISKDYVDGFYFGWSVGCPRFCFNDGIHGIDKNTPAEKHLTIFYLDSADECVKKWNDKVKNYFEQMACAED